MSKIPEYEGKEYDEKSILTVDARKHMRTRPQVYLGGTPIQQLHELIRIILENSVAHALNGYTNSITVTLHNASTITIEDNRDFTESELHKGWEKLYFEMLITHNKVLPSTIKGAFNLGDTSNYSMSIVNALCSKMDVVVKQSGSVWEAQYAEGLPISDPKMRAMEAGEAIGTKITFSPDLEVFEKNDFQPTIIMDRLQELSFLIPNITYTFVNHLSDENGTTTTFFSQNGLADYIAFLNRDKKPLHPPITLKIHGELEKTIDGFKDILIEIAFQYVDDYTFYHLNYINTNKMSHEGVDTETFLKVLKYSMDDKANLPKSHAIYGFTFSEITYGLVVITNIFHSHPMFAYATRWTLINPELENLVSRAMYDKFKEISETDPQLMDILHQKCLANYEYHRTRKMGG